MERLLNLRIILHDFLQSQFKSKFDIVVSNPPYIALNDINELQTEVKNYDPYFSLTDQADGLSFYRRFAEQFDNLLNPNGFLILEFGGNEQKVAIEEIFSGTNLYVKFFKDLQKNWRVVEVRK